MIDFKLYDEGKARYLSSLKLKQTPLKSWDFYGAFYHEANQIYGDISKLDRMSEIHRWEQFGYREALWNKKVVIVTTPGIELVFASQNMLYMNGYCPEEVLGKSPKIFQGKDTCIETLYRIRMAILAQKTFDEVILNYRKDGSPYYCHIQGFPVFDSKGTLKHFIALEQVVS